MNITAPVLSFSGAHLPASGADPRVDGITGGSPAHARTASSGGVGGVRTSAAPSTGIMGGRILSSHNKTQMINSSRVGQAHGLGPLGPSPGSPQHFSSNLQGRIPAGRQHGSNLASPKQVNSATGMPAAPHQQNAHHLGGKRTIVSGIVRRQPLPAGQAAEHHVEPAEAYMSAASAASGGG